MKKILIILCAVFTCGVSIAQTIRWHIGDTVYQTTTCNAGESITPPTAPDKFGYTFIRYDAYTPIEYLEITGTQFITSDSDITLPFAYIRIGVSISTAVQMDFFSSKLGSVYYVMPQQNFCLWRNNGLCNQTGVSTGIKYDIEYIATPTNLTIKVDNNPVRFNMNIDISEFTYFRFGSINTGRLFYGKIYYVQILDPNGVLLFDFIPVLDKDGTPCMYDKVEHKFYYNAGTGQFIAGPVLTE